MPLKIISHDITTLQVDAIVNSTNHRMIGYAGVDQLIHELGGPEFEKECEALAGKNVPGGAVYTNAYNMPCRYIIHTQAPTWDGGIHGEAAILASCYKKSLHLATELGCDSVAFPLLSAGNRMYPVAEALEIAVTTIREYLDLYDDINVTLALFGEVVENIAKETIEDLDEYVKQEYKPGKTLSKEEQEKAVDVLLAHPHKSFAQIMKMHMKNNGIKNNGIICFKSGLSKQVVSAVSTGKVTPSKRTAVGIAMALELSWDETVSLLASAGIALGSSDEFDVIVKYFIKNGLYKFGDLDVQLQKHHLETYFPED